jgi:hypothetical protein
LVKKSQKGEHYAKVDLSLKAVNPGESMKVNMDESPIPDKRVAYWQIRV